MINAKNLTPAQRRIIISKSFEELLASGVDFRDTYARACVMGSYAGRTAR